MTPSQTAMAEAGVAALSVFKIPAPFEASFYNQPDPYSVLVHAVPSSFTESGFQAVLVLHAKSEIPEHLGLPPPPPPPSSSSSSNKGYEETAFLMSAPKTQPFVMYHQAPRALTLQITVMEYLTLLAFMGKEWPRVKSKLTHQLTTMKEGSEPISIAPHLSFYGHGSCHFQISLSHRLALKAKAESRSLRENEERMTAHHVKAWLELKSDASTGATPSNEEFALPLEALAALVQDQRGVKTLTDLVAAYKSRSRKRNKSVA